MRSLLLFILVGLSTLSKAQDKGVVHFLVDVDNGYFEIVIDDTMYLKLYKCELPVGIHSAKIWSPGYITTEIEFEVRKDQTTEKYVEMAISNQRQEYEAEYKAYRMDFHKSLTVPLSTTLFLGITSGVFMIKAYSTKKAILKDVDLYFKSPTYQEVISYKTSIEDNNKRYNRQRFMFYTTLGLTAASIGTTIYLYSKFKHNSTEPKLNAESPFKEKFSLNISPFGLGLNWKIG